ncbi:hypothetical protein ONE63_001675 [Megalurothrips usitatus]|uniref:Uncharacterized protein n=1 Tax=Megalurothrips usitatus TaxID=439358 RepID=A0AAV7XD88_9NEOP|nr:hypothetical protein ONE63_001675 [Megalurothrips usitatus]
MTLRLPDRDTGSLFISHRRLCADLGGMRFAQYHPMPRRGRSHKSRIAMRSAVVMVMTMCLAWPPSTSAHVLRPKAADHICSTTACTRAGKYLRRAE